MSTGPGASGETWRGLIVAPEERCAPYDRERDYSPPRADERAIARNLGGIFSPYTGTCFASLRETDIEHIVAVSEAHDSGLCAQDAATKARFVRDLRNLALASPRVNRHEKGAKDAAGWLPDRNRCWFAARVVAVRRAYGLSIDRDEAAALERILSACTDTALQRPPCLDLPLPARRPAARLEPTHPAARYDDNGDGRITCREARRHRIAPVPSTHPAYEFMWDGDGDGTVCE